MRIATRVSSVVLLSVLAAPLLGIAALSVSSNQGMDIFTTLHGSLHWWHDLLNDVSWLTALLSSALIGFGSALLALLLTLPPVLLWRLESSRIAGYALILAAMSLTVPPIVLAVGLYHTMALIGLFDTGIGLSLSHLAFTVPVATLILSSRFRSTPLESYLAARSLGAGRFHAAIRWVKATQRMTLFGCLCACMLTSISEVTVAIYVTDTSVPNIARRALRGVTRDISPAGFVAMTVWVGILFLAFLPIALRASRQRRIYG